MYVVLLTMTHEKNKEDVIVEAGASVRAHGMGSKPNQKSVLHFFESF